jgi:hypothetical protein
MDDIRRLLSPKLTLIYAGQTAADNNWQAVEDIWSKHLQEPGVTAEQPIVRVESIEPSKEGETKAIFRSTVTGKKLACRCIFERENGSWIQVKQVVDELDG